MVSSSRLLLGQVDDMKTGHPPIVFFEPRPLFRLLAGLIRIFGREVCFFRGHSGPLDVNDFLKPEDVRSSVPFDESIAEVLAMADSFVGSVSGQRLTDSICRSADLPMEQKEEVAAVLVSRMCRQVFDVAEFLNRVGRGRSWTVIASQSLVCAGLRVTSSHRCFYVPRVPKLQLKKAFRPLFKFRTVKSTVRDGVSKSDARSGVILLTHQGDSYSSLYRWEQYYSTIDGSVFSERRLTKVDDTSFSSFSLSTLWRRNRVSFVRWHLIGIFTALRAPRGARAPLILQVTWLILMTRSSADRLSREYPGTNMVLFAYDMLVPGYLSLAFGSLGIFRAAAVERSNSIKCAYPVIADLLLVPTEHFGQLASRHPTFSIRKFEVTGLWRTDYLRGVTTAADRSRTTIVVLPFHVEKSCSDGASRLETNWDTAVKFFDDLVALSMEFKDCQFVVRGKDTSWLAIPRVREIFEIDGRAGNIIIDADYTAFGRSYQLVAECQVVIGKYTSLIDEAYLAGWPCVVHEVYPFGRRLYRDWNFLLPEACVATTTESFLELSARAIVESRTKAVIRGEASAPRLMVRDMILGHLERAASSLVPAIGSEKLRT